jgi:hypothetical protein
VDVMLDLIQIRGMGVTSRLIHTLYIGVT